jgi:hypothetical protein
MSHSFNSYYADKEWKPEQEAVTPFQDILQKIIDFDCEIEIIGYWIYSKVWFNTPRTYGSRLASAVSIKNI